MFIKAFGTTLSIAALITSVAMMTMGAKWQKIEQAAYASSKRPWWFVTVSILLLAFYAMALIEFISAQKTVAGWILMVAIPVLWIVKAAVIIFNPRGRAAVSGISGDQAWIKIGLARLPIAILVGLLTWFA
ncbi:hypothetical protein SAMN05660297_03014 [Natronincola peptidivorans]|uniref:Uncharacterized protein n=1 Tax=Natronincola peptidivorans TaxID=426128 RepID=A0A1I0G2P7_9FIRM|nr:hypothetical protein [Natronincola peptidivorans]SET64144.1 hypothetical protein SAMN05660297_03014 [Natronincola peptidivorans]